MEAVMGWIVVSLILTLAAGSSWLASAHGPLR